MIIIEQTILNLGFSNLQTLLADIVNEENVVPGSSTQPIDPTLSLFLNSVKPQLIVKPNEVDDLLKIIDIANRYKIPLTPKSSSINFRGASSPLIGGLVVDFSNMNKILEIKPDVMDGVYARIEPGVTFRQLQNELKNHNAFALTPARAPADVSVVSSYLNREILYTNYKHGFNIDDIILSMEIALGTGRLLYTGSYTLHYTGHGGTYPHTHGMDLGYFITGSLGTLGMVTKMNFKIKDLNLYPLEKINFIESKNFEGLINTSVELSRATSIEIGDVHLIMNKYSLASLVAKDKADYDRISDNASDWTYIIRVNGEEDWIACQEADIQDLAKRQTMESTETTGIKDLEKTLLNEFNIPEGIMRALKFNPFARVSFFCPKKKINELYNVAFNEAKNYGYNDNIGCVIIPIEQTRSFYMEFEYYFDPNSAEQRSMMKNVIKAVYSKAYNNGAFISVPREPFLASYIYQKIQPYFEQISKMKKILDPNNIMHPSLIFR